MSQNTNGIITSHSSKMPRKTGFVFDDLGHRPLQTSHQVNADWLAIQAAGDLSGKGRSAFWQAIFGGLVSALSKRPSNR